jgi:hypothetical protein
MKINFFIKKEPSPEDMHKKLMDVSRAINGNIEFGNPKDGAVNIQGSWQNVTTPSSANTEFTLTHNLGYIPSGIHVISLDKAAIIYASRKTSWTTTQAFFKADQASVALTGFII